MTQLHIYMQVDVNPQAPVVGVEAYYGRKGP